MCTQDFEYSSEFFVTLQPKPHWCLLLRSFSVRANSVKTKTESHKCIYLTHLTYIYWNSSYFIYQNSYTKSFHENSLSMTFIKCVSMRQEKNCSPLQCLKTMHPPSWSNKIYPPNCFWHPTTSIKCSKQNVTLPLTMHIPKISTTLKHVKIITPTLKCYIPKKFLRKATFL